MDPQENMRRRFEEKHQQMCNTQLVEQLSRNREQNKLRREEEEAPDENIDAFDKEFAYKTKTIRERIQILAAGASLASDIDSLKQELIDLGSRVTESAHFLHPYTITSCQGTINQVYEELFKTQSSLMPRKKFAFSRRKERQTQETSAVENKPDQFQVQLEGIQGVSDAHIVKTDAELSQYNCYQLKNLQNCEIVLSGRLKALHMLNLKNCVIYVGPVSGSAHITDCEDCVINIASHQLRIHQSVQCEFYVHTTTIPIVESVKDVGFAPYSFTYQGIEEHFAAAGLNATNNWDQVKDFKWLKKEPSPNWRIIHEQDRREYKTIY